MLKIENGQSILLFEDRERVILDFCAILVDEKHNIVLNEALLFMDCLVVKSRSDNPPHPWMRMGISLQNRRSVVVRLCKPSPVLEVSASRSLLSGDEGDLIRRD